MFVFGRSALCFAANALLTVAIFIFATGFFPHKVSLPGLATWPPDSDFSHPPAPFDKLIFMVVDALRSDFVYSNTSNFKFTQSLIRQGAALPFTGHAGPPTITMPRVKALTTGSAPSFLDVILNFAESDGSSSLASQDTWLAQMRAKPDGKLVMYGDDTWLRLFPQFFARSDGTTSFFVSDFTEVDNNVTRHVPRELSRDDWSVMVLHYLGLDHIGHKTGPRGPKMPTKQAEMDDIVKTIYTAMEDQKYLSSSLLVLLGDHGMNEAGNHGASSAGEVSAALTFISPKFRSIFDGIQCPAATVDDFSYYDAAEQSDVAATLAALLGFPTPRNSLGIVIHKLLSLWPSEQERLDLLYANARQLYEVAHASFPGAFAAHEHREDCQPSSLQEPERLACRWASAQMDYKSAIIDSLKASDACSVVSSFLADAQSVLSATASDYDITKMYAGVGITVISTAFSLIHVVKSSSASRYAAMGLVFMIGLYSMTMFASSYVEEEHQFWYWIFGGWLAVLECKELRWIKSGSIIERHSGALAAMTFAIVRRWHQTGQKYAGEPDLASKILAPHPWLLWLLVVGTYSLVSRRMSDRASKWMIGKSMAILPVLVCLSSLSFKVAFTAAEAPELLDGMTFLKPILSFLGRYPLVNLARITFLGTAHLTACAVIYETPWRGRDHRHQFMLAMHDLLSLLLITQTRTTNIPLFMVFAIHAYALEKCRTISATDLSVTSLMLQYSSFFAFGGTNAISSVDLSNAYNGISGYNVAAVGILTFVSNWAGPIWWASATFLLMSNLPVTNRRQRLVPSHYGILSLFASVSALAVMLACTLLREHLFIWTVFSPKYLYSIAWVVGQHLVINGLLGSVLMGWLADR